MDNSWYLGVRTPEALGMAGAWEDTMDWEVTGCSSYLASLIQTSLAPGALGRRRLGALGPCRLGPGGVVAWGRCRLGPGRVVAQACWQQLG